MQSRHHRPRRSAVLIVIVLASVTAGAQRIVVQMTPERILEAIRAGERGQVPAAGLYESSGWAWGRLHFGYFSTPFMRVAAAARQAKTEYRTLTPAAIPEELLAPELHVYGLAIVDGARVSNVRTIVITPRRGSREEKFAAAIHPIRMTPIPAVYQNLFGATFHAESQLAVFPLDVLSDRHEVHVVYDSAVTIGTNRAGGVSCTDCSMAFSLKGLR